MTFGAAGACGSRILLGVALLSGCGEHPDPAEPQTPRAPAFSFISGPADPGPVVLRSDDDTFIVLFNTDPSTGLASIIRLPDPPSDVFQCGGSQPLQSADLQLVFHANGAIQQLMIGDQAHAWVYDRQTFLAIANSSGVCAALATLTPLADGLVDFVARDNDLFASGTRTNAFGWTARGVLYLTSDGSPVDYQNLYHGAVGADGTVYSFASSIVLK